jgi:hypothetical protein
VKALQTAGLALFVVAMIPACVIVAVSPCATLAVEYFVNSFIFGKETA